MKGNFLRIYPEKDRTIFDGGLNNKYPITEILDNESPDCLNVMFGNGTVETREGFTKLNTASVGSFACDGLYVRRDNTNAETMVAWFGGTCWQLAGTSFSTIGSAQSIFTAGIRVGSAQDENHIFFDNGGSIPYKWNGTAFTRHGVYPPTTTLTVGSANVVGALTASGEYRYKITFVNSQSVESDVGPVSTTFVISTTSGQNTLSVIPTAPQSWGIGSRRVYRNAAAGTTFKRVGVIADNTTTTFTDNVADGDLGATAPTDNGVPPKWNSCVYHQTRLFMNDTANPNYVWYTEAANPYTVASTNFIRIGDNTSDLVKGLAVYDNSIVVFCEKSVWLIYMPTTDPTGWVQIRSKSSYGSISPYCLIDFQNKVLFPAVHSGQMVGFSALQGDAVQPSATLLTISNAGSEFLSDRVEDSVFEVQNTYISNISGITYKNQIFITVTYGSGSTANNRVFVYDFSITNLSKEQDAAWVPWSGISAAQFAVYAQNLYFGSSVADGFVHKLFNGTYSDNGSAINSYFSTKEFSGEDTEINYAKDFRYGKFLVGLLGNYNMGVNYLVDSDSGTGNLKLIDLDAGGNNWNALVWGTDTWGGGSTRQEVKVFLDGARGQRIQFKFSNLNTVSQGFRVFGQNFAYNRKGYR